MNTEPNHTPSSNDSWINRQIIEASPSGIIVVDACRPDLPIVSVNTAFEQTTGYHRSEVIGRNCRFLQGDDREQPGRAIIRDALHRGDSCTALLRNYRKDGTLFWNELRIAPIQNAQGLITHFIGIQNDVTRRVQAENALAESEARRRTMLHAMPDMIFRIRSDGTYLDCHVPDPDLLFASPANFIGQKISAVMPPDFAEISMYLIEQALHTGQQRKYEYDLPVGNALRQFEARIVPAERDEVLVIVRDVTDRQRAERDAFALALEQERSKLLVGFIQNAAHEFRTPLSIINSSTYLLLRAGDPNRRAEKARQIEAQVQRTSRLVDMLLDMTRLEYLNTLALDHIPVQRVYDAVCADVQAFYGDKPRLHQETVPDLPPALGSHDDLMLAFRQILDNAYHFTPPDGAIYTSLTVHGDYIRLEVQDTGAGIEPDALPHIFETFWRQDTAHTTPGFGLGLSIARRIIELHGGRITITSSPPSGTHVQVDLPAALSHAYFD